MPNEWVIVSDLHNQNRLVHMSENFHLLLQIETNVCECLRVVKTPGPARARIHKKDSCIKRDYYDRSICELGIKYGIAIDFTCSAANLNPSSAQPRIQ